MGVLRLLTGFLVWNTAMGGCAAGRSHRDSGECNTNNDCEAGDVCQDHECKTLCTGDNDCDPDEVCDNLVCIPGEQRPDNPTDVSASDGEDAQVTIAFTMPAEPVTECVLRRATQYYPSSHADGTEVGGPFTVPEAAESHVDTGRQNGTTYYYAVYCRNGETWNDDLDTTPTTVNGDTGQPSGGGAAEILFDAATATHESNDHTSLSFWHTVGSGSNRLLIVGLAFGESAWQLLPDVTYAGQAMTFLVREESNNTSAAIWYLVGPQTGRNTVEMTGLSSYGDDKIAGAVSFFGVDPNNPLGTFASAAGDSEVAAVNVASTAGQVVVDVVSTYKQELTTVGADQTEHWSQLATTRSGGCSQEAGGGVVTMSWTGTFLEPDWHNWAIIGVPVRPASN